MNSIAIVTGGSRGLGRNTAVSIARRSGDVIITYRNNAEDAKAVVADIEAIGRKAVALQLDLGNPSTIPAFVERVRSVLKSAWQRDSFDHLVNNAGHGEMAALAETTEAQFDGLLDVHVKGVFFLTQALLPLLANGGRIVNFSSGLRRIAVPGFSAYSAAKGAVEILTLYMAKEFAGRGITANTIAPGAIETDFLGGAVRDTPAYNQAFASMTARPHWRAGRHRPGGCRTAWS
jgi:NAD(P)-dependent dehydrogenase (short-subunit alcohol dehydrogenase family)